VYGDLGFRMFEDIGRVYVNEKARTELGWRPTYDFGKILTQLRDGAAIGSELARSVGSKGYHDELFDNGPFPVEPVTSRTR
jgi:UDP-glucose 4-epimerase